MYWAMIGQFLILFPPPTCPSDSTPTTQKGSHIIDEALEVCNTKNKQRNWPRQYTAIVKAAYIGDCKSLNQLENNKQPQEINSCFSIIIT